MFEKDGLSFFNLFPEKQYNAIKHRMNLALAAVKRNSDIKSFFSLLSFFSFLFFFSFFLFFSFLSFLFCLSFLFFFSFLFFLFLIGFILYIRPEILCSYFYQVI